MAEDLTHDKRFQLHTISIKEATCLPKKMTYTRNEEPQDMRIQSGIHPNVNRNDSQAPSFQTSSHRNLHRYLRRRATDDMSIITDTSQATLQINNRRIPDDATLHTTASMVTAPIVNTTTASSSMDTSNDNTTTTTITSTTTTTTDPIRQRPVRVPPVCIDSQGRTVTFQELKQIRKRAGKCHQCGITVTHKRRNCGPFGLCHYLVPITAEGLSYKGICLYCHTLDEIQEMLSEPNLSLSAMPDHNLSDTIHTLSSDERGEIDIQARQSPQKFVVSSICFQITITTIIISLGMMINFLSIARFQFPESQSPTTAPSSSPYNASMQWKFSAEIKSNHVSFGYRVKLSSDGTILAVSSPKFDNGRGRFDVYKLKFNSGQKVWYHIDPLFGTHDSGTAMGDFMSFGMALSGDGLTLAVGSPGKRNGLVATYSINPHTMTVTTKANPLEGLMPQCQFGYSVALNMDGTRLFVGAPNDGMTETERNGSVRAYDYNHTTDTWAEIGSIMIGDHNGSRFGHSVASGEDGSHIVIGAPLDSSRFENAGKVHYFMLDPQRKLWYQYPSMVPIGETMDTQLGSRVATSADGKISASSARDNPDMELHSDFGIVYAHFYDAVSEIVDYMAYPLSGTRKNAGFGYDVDLSNFGDVLLVSEQNTQFSAGIVRVYRNDVIFIQEGEVVGPSLGLCESLGKGPSVSLASVEKATLAIGYECLLSNGLSTSEIRLYDYYYLVND
jgi:hypothetical protein